MSALAVLAFALSQGSPVPSARPLSTRGTTVISEWKASILADSPPLPGFGGVGGTAAGVALTTDQQPPFVYSLQAHIPNAVPVRKGETLMIRFAARSLRPDHLTGVTKAIVSFGRASGPWELSVHQEIGMSATWQRFDIPFVCENDFEARQGRVCFDFGYPAQTVEIADVQALRFPPGVLPSSLPKTRRVADPVAPSILRQQIARIAAFKRDLDAVKDPAPAHGRTLHVEKRGTADGDGSAERPFATIRQALATVRPGDTVLVGPGEYREPWGIDMPISGRSDAWIKLKAAPGARPRLVDSGWEGIRIKGALGYIEIAGFEFQWAKDPAIFAHGAAIGPQFGAHHIRILNNVVHGFGTGGIGTADCDYVTIENNTIYDCCKTSPYGGSAISLNRAFEFDHKPGYHNVIRRNVCYDNELTVPTNEGAGGNGRILTHGNGIIIDCFDLSRVNPLKPYPEDVHGPTRPCLTPTLIESNLIYDNGGRGVHVFRSQQVDVLNNTCYMNQKSADINAGELTAIQSKDVVLMRNLAYGRTHKRGNTQDGSTRVIWADNLLYNADDVLLHPGVVTKDPLFRAGGLLAPPDGFRLRKDSPAKGKGAFPDPRESIQIGATDWPPSLPSARRKGS